jgi:hypothetical protein
VVSGVGPQNDQTAFHGQISCATKGESPASSKQILAGRRIDLEHIAVALILKTDVKDGEREKFVYSHIDDCGSITAAIQDSGISVYVRIRKIGRQVVTGVDRGRPLLEMIVALSRIGEQRISGDIAAVPVLSAQLPS